MYSAVKRWNKILILVLFGLTAIGAGPAAADGFAPTLEANLSFSIPGLEDPVYGQWGWSIKVTQEIWSNDFTAFSAGLKHSMYMYSLSGLTPYGGDDGFSMDTGLYAVAAQTFHPFPGRRMYFGIELFFGWNALHIRGEVEEDYLGGRKSYSDTSHIFNWGTTLKVGCMVSPSVGIHGFTRVSLKGATDGDGSGILDGDIAGPDTKIYAGLGCLLRTDGGR